MIALCDKLAISTPSSFTYRFTFLEKLDLLGHLVDLVHD